MWVLGRWEWNPLPRRLLTLLSGPHGGQILPFKNFGLTLPADPRLSPFRSGSLPSSPGRPRFVIWAKPDCVAPYNERLRSAAISGRLPSHLLPSAANRASRPRGGDPAPPPRPARGHFRPGLRTLGRPTCSGRRAARLSAQARGRGPSRSPALPTLSRQPGGVSYSRASSLNATAVPTPCALRRHLRPVRKLGLPGCGCLARCRRAWAGLVPAGSWHPGDGGGAAAKRGGLSPGAAAAQRRWSSWGAEPHLLLVSAPDPRPLPPLALALPAPLYSCERAPKKLDTFPRELKRI